MAREVSYIEEARHCDELSSLMGPEQWTDEYLLPGDVVFCRNETALTTRLIERLDGFFSHVGIYVGGGRMVHSFTGGVVEWELTSDSFEQYNCLAVGRPKAPSIAARKRVASWAERQVNDETVPFGAFDLGQTCALLARARFMFWRRFLPKPSTAAIDETIERATELLESAAQEGKVVMSTCAGFAWRSWAQSDHPVTPQLVKGTLISDGLLRKPDDDISVLEWLADGAPPAMESAAGLPLMSDEELEKYKRLARLAGNAFPGLRRMANPTNDVPLHEAVAPGDLWCSPDMEQRFFLADRFKQQAAQH